MSKYTDTDKYKDSDKVLSLKRNKMEELKIKKTITEKQISNAMLKVVLKKLFETKGEELLGYALVCEAILRLKKN